MILGFVSLGMIAGTSKIAFGDVENGGRVTKAASTKQHKKGITFDSASSGFVSSVPDFNTVPVGTSATVSLPRNKLPQISQRMMHEHSGILGPVVIVN